VHLILGENIEGIPQRIRRRQGWDEHVNIASLPWTMMLKKVIDSNMDRPMQKQK
jgi:hypothetical protein